MKKDICITLALVLSFVFIISLINNRDRTFVYDCRKISYPMAVDIPQEVILKCRRKQYER